MPDLTPQQKAQLDSNIRAMLSKGASQDDVMAYSKDFRNKYDVAIVEPQKKKEDWVSKTFGRGSQESGLSGGSGLGKVGMAVEPSVKSEKQQLADYITGLKEKPSNEDYAVAIKKTTPLVQVNVKHPYSSEKIDSEARNKINEVMYDENDDWKDPIKYVTKKTLSQNTIPTTKDLLINDRANKLMAESIAGSGFHAKNLLLDSEWGKGDDNNETKKLLQNRVAEYEKVASEFRSINPTELTYLTKDKLYDAAIRSYANKNPHFAEQMQAAGVDLGKDDIRLSMGDGDAKVGQILTQVFRDPDLQDVLENENPSLIPFVKEANDNLIYDNKDYGKVQLANEISRDMEKEGYNKIDPIFNFEGNAKKMGDATAELLYLNDPKKLQFYRENKEEILNKLDAPSLVNSVWEGGTGFGKGILNTFTEPFTSTSKTLKDNWEKEASHVSADPTGLVKFLSDAGHALGFIGAIAATGNILGLTGMTANTASMTSLGVGFLGDNLEQAKVKYPNSPVKQWTSALFNTGLYMAMGKNLFPAAKVEQAIAKVQPGISNVIENLASGKITREAARAELNTWGKKAIDIAGDGLKKNLKVSAEMTGITILNKTLDRLMGMDDKTFEEFHPEGEEGDTFKSMFLSNILVNGMAAYGQNRAKNNIAKESIYEAATYPNRYRNVIESSEISKNVTDTKDMLDNLDYIVNLKKDLDARGLNEKQKKDYLFNALKSKVLNASKPQSPDATLTRQHSERIKNLEEINQGILEGKDADEVVTTEEQKIRDEQDKATEQQNKLVEQGHKAVKGLLEETDKDDKPKLKGIYRDIAKDNPMGFLQEIADQAFGMERVDGERVKSSSPVPELDLIPKYGADVVNTAKKLFPLEAEKPKLEDQVRELPDENTLDEAAGVSGSALSVKERNKIIQNHLLDNEGDIDGAFKKAGYVSVNGIWIAPEAVEYAKKVSPEVWKHLKDNGIKYLEGGDDGRGLQKTISYDGKNIRGIGVNENVGENHSGHNHTMLHELAHHVWQEELTPEQRKIFQDDNPISDYAKSVKEGKEKTLAKHDEEDFAELYAKNNGSIEKAIAEKKGLSGSALKDVVDDKTKQQLLDERLNKIKEIKDKAEGTREERTKRYKELVNELGDETAALKKLQEEINNRAKEEIDKLPELPKTENEIINEKGEADFEKIKKDLGFKRNDKKWGNSPMDEDMGDMLLSNDKEAVIFIKPNEVEIYDEKNDQTDNITNGIKIELVSTKESSRGKGKAKELIKKVADWADKNGTDLHLDIAPQDKSTTESGLKKLYESFGFEFDGIHGIRKPKAPTQYTEAAGGSALKDVDLGGGIKNKATDEGVNLLPISEIDNLRSQKQTDLATGNAVEMEKDLSKNGIKEPLVITYYPNEGKAVLTDGHNRLDVAKDMGAEKLPIRIVERYTDAPNNAKDWTPPQAPTQYTEAAGVSGSALKDVEEDSEKWYKAKKTIKDKDGNDIKLTIDKNKDDKHFYIKATDSNGKEVGSALFETSDGEVWSGNEIEVNEANRRKGIMSAMYDFAESEGHPLEPTKTLSKEGKAFWDNRKAPTQYTEASGVSGSALKDVESTAKALDENNSNPKKSLSRKQYALLVKESEIKYEKSRGNYNEFNAKRIENRYQNNLKSIKENNELFDVDEYSYNQGTISGVSNELSEAYHKAKEDGTNPELVKAVEDLLGKAPTQYTEASGVSGSALKDVESKIQEASLIKDDVERKKELDKIYNSDEYKNWIKDAEEELKNNKTQVAEGKGSWRKAFNETSDAMRKKDILRAVADVSTDINELNEISKASKGLPEGLQSEIDYAVEHKKKSLAPTQYTEAATPKDQAQKIAELTEQRDRELTKAGKPEIAEMSLSDKDFAKLPAEEQNKYEEWEKKESKLRKLIDCLWKMK